MPTHTDWLPLSEKSERAAVEPPVVGFDEPIRVCPVCGTPLTGRQTSACSDRCRAAKSRRTRAEVQAKREDRLRGLVKVLAKAAGLTPEDLT